MIALLCERYVFTLMRYRQDMYRVGKAQGAFGLGRNMGGSGSLPAARVGGHTPSHGRLPSCPGCAYEYAMFATVRSIAVEVAVDVLMSRFCGDEPSVRRLEL
jgi:Asp-tRNA(Asn)/Glu-tRNA(Gln) amidotransferase A subunit family amidase